MKIRILDRILVALAGLLVLAGCAALAAQLFCARLSQTVEEDTKCGMHR